MCVDVRTYAEEGKGQVMFVIAQVPLDPDGIFSNTVIEEVSGSVPDGVPQFHTRNDAIRYLAGQKDVDMVLSSASMGKNAGNEPGTNDD